MNKVSPEQSSKESARTPAEYKLDHSELPEVWRNFYERVRLSSALPDTKRK